MHPDAEGVPASPDRYPADQYPAEDHPDYEYIEKCRRLSFWLDGAFAVPGTGFRFGLDGLIGLIPGFGDALTMLVSLRILALAKEAGVPATTMLRMAVNTGIDWGIGSIPLFGDLFDFFFKSNKRNLAMLEREILRRIDAERR